MKVELVTRKRGGNPKVPELPANARSLAQKLLEIINTSDERSTLAYGALTRISVYWTRPSNVSDVVLFTIETSAILEKLFPAGAGLTEEEQFWGVADPTISHTNQDNDGTEPC